MVKKDIINDKKMLDVAQRNPQTIFKDLADKAAMHPTTFRRHFDHWAQKGVIDTHPRLDPKEIGLHIAATVLVKTFEHGKQKIKEFQDRVIANANVLEAHTVNGDYDYVLKVMVPDYPEWIAFQRWINDDPTVEKHTSYLAAEELKRTHILPLTHLEE